MYEAIKPALSTNITIIAFRRPDLLLTTLKTLAINHDVEQLPLWIFIDGARPEKEGEKEAVEETVKIAEAFKWKNEKKIFASEKNKGLQQGVRYAIDTSLENFESTIIVEDDIVTSPFFIRFMLRGLNRFADNSDVAAICGHVYPFSRKKFNPQEPYFLKHLACWGWATWRRSWNQVCWNTGTLISHLKKEGSYRELNFGIGEFVTGILNAQHNNYIDTWDVQTGVSFYLNGQHCLFPPETLTNNTGWRPTGHSTHVYSETNFNAPLAYHDFIIPDQLQVTSSSRAWKAYSQWEYPFHIKCRIIIKKCLLLAKTIILFFAPFLRGINKPKPPKE